MARVWIGCALALALAACGDPMAGVPRLDEVATDAAAGQAEVLEPEVDSPPEVDPAPRRGLLGLFQRRAEAATAEETAPAETADTASDADDLATDSAPSGEATAEAPPADPAPEEEAAPARRGLFGFLRGRGGASEGETGPELAALPAPLADGGAPVADAPDARTGDIARTLPYGEVARVCGVPDRQLGTRSARYPESGRGYTLYDSAPGGTAMRSFFLTGFKDGCARQFSAALVLFGDPETWEQLHYGAAGAVQPTSETDIAYERVKSRFCRVRKGQPCGSRMRALARTTVFVNVYERFGDSPRWKNILLHEGEVVAIDIKD